jgi:hypothetical protein
MLSFLSQVYEHVCEESAAMDSAVRQNAKLVQALRDRLASAVQMSTTDGTVLQAPAADRDDHVMQSMPVNPMCRAPDVSLVLQNIHKILAIVPSQFHVCHLCASLSVVPHGQE